MHDFKDISGVAGVATARTTAETDLLRSRAKLWDEGVSDSPQSAGFANPVANSERMGITHGMKVADFGAGSGAYTIAAARLVGKSGRVYAVDVQKDLLTRIKNNATKEGIDWIDLCWGDFEKNHGSKIADKSIDVVIISNTVFQLDDAPGAFLEASRVLKDDGRLAVIDWSDSFGGLGPIASEIVTKEKAVALAAKAGFGPLNEFTAGAHHYGIIFKPGGYKA
ncbi:MAG: methyltransferase domain-containing protein [Patescibacteria group bacterium]